MGGEEEVGEGGVGGGGGGWLEGGVFWGVQVGGERFGGAENKRVWIGFRRMKSNYQMFKLWWLAVLPLAKDAIHIYIGFLCLLLALILFRRKLSSFTALIPGLLVSHRDGGPGPAGRLRLGGASRTSSTRTCCRSCWCLLARWQTFNF